MGGPLVADARTQLDGVARELAITDGPVRILETHISWVLLTNTRAYKFRKPVSLPFVDFSTLAARRHDCDEEIRLNRRLAPGLYLGVTKVTATRDGVELDGSGPVLDVAVCMKRFPDEALWSELIRGDNLSRAHVEKLAFTMSQFHRKAPAAAEHSEYGDFAAIEKVTLDLIRNIEALHPGAGPQAIGTHWAPVRQWLLTSLHVLKGVFIARQEEGRVRECHGDLHLANVVQFSNEPTPFDGLEFDPALRWIDVISDVAFMMMDLMAHQRSDLAYRFINAYLEDSGDYLGLNVLRFYLVSRALVRFQVKSLAQRQDVEPTDGVTADDYLRLAARVVDEQDPRVAIMYGLPGTGKTTVSSRLIEAAGAIRVRSDVERKRLFGLRGSDSTARAGAQMAYQQETTERTYERLREVAATVLLAGFPVVVDAAFLLRKQRDMFARLALDSGVSYTILACEAPLEVLRTRIAERLRRGDDASEADADVLEKLRGIAEPPGPDEQEHTLSFDATDARQIEKTVLNWSAVTTPDSASV